MTAHRFRPPAKGRPGDSVRLLRDVPRKVGTTLRAGDVFEVVERTEPAKGIPEYTLRDRRGEWREIPDSILEPANAGPGAGESPGEPGRLF